MNVFETPEETYAHLRTVHGGIHEQDPAAAVGGARGQDFLEEQAEALARFERLRVAREEVLRRPVGAAANPFGDPHAHYRAQFVGERMRDARVVANVDQWHVGVRVADDAQEEARRVRVAADARRARDAEIIRENLEARAERVRQVRLARVADDAQEEARRARDAEIYREARAEQVRQLMVREVPQRRVGVTARRQEEDRGWCILM